ncbi:Vq motif-containing protein [Thalictrum thalictroides]|uniref:Vq motif-containing protein n=1 Tax=Thalictrum thalictroides TaxID=46969 RepID=A0A7J6VL30_THATH|nr:Vq motif-containing protein [Thalictrum thalictroides]
MIRRTPPPPFDHSQQDEIQNQQQNQPPVYNINKSDFREVVQKLTGSPAHDRFSNPSQPLTKPQTSRLQRIRPPPLAHLSTRPSSSLNNAIPLPPTFNPNCNFNNNGRPISPLSPLPPFPTVHAAVESPISAYMKYLRGSILTNDSDPKPFGALSPRWSNTNDYIMPNSPLAFGSPRSPCLPSLPSPTIAQLGHPHLL